MTPPIADLVVLGAGAKAAAVAAKVHAVNELRLTEVPIALTIVEANENAASWLGLNGMTSGDEPLAITPIKDAGFPYESGAAFGAVGDAIDAEMLGLSWQSYLIAGQGFARWVNAGSPGIRHRDYGAYLAWVFGRATNGVRIVRGRVEQVGLDVGAQRWSLDVAEPGGRRERHDGRALLLTGSGVHRPLPHEPAAAERMFHCDDKRSEIAARIPADRRSEIAIVGGGEGALSCLAFLRAMRPAARLTVHTPSLPMSRGESFLENRAFSNPDTVDWTALDLATRRLFVQQCDRGVFGPDGLDAFSYDDRCRFVTGRVVHVGAERDGRGVRLEHDAPTGMRTDRYDFVVNCTGFDLLEQLRGLFPPAVRAAIERQAGPLWDLPPGAELPIGRWLEVAGMAPRLHLPGLAGLSQGPGFANLGCLGLLADRVVAPLVVERDDVPQVAPGAAVLGRAR
jgi:mycobactin lysine-N-oxygenase